MKETLTPEQRSALAPYERHLHTALYAGYVVGLQMHIKKDVLWPIFMDVYHSNPGHPTCNYCVMQVCKKLGVLYYDNAPEKGQNDTLPSTNTSEVTQVPTEEKKAPQKAKKAPKKKTNKK